MDYQIRTLTRPASGLKFTESPRWHKGKLWFLDIHDNRIKSVDMSGTVETQQDLPFTPNAFGFTPDGAMVVGDAFKRRIHRCIRGDIQSLADISGMATFCLSDGIVDTKGRFYVGDIGYNFLDATAKPVTTCVLVRVDSDRQVSVVARDLSFPNGMVISPDGRTLIVAETLGNRLTSFDIQPDGGLGLPRIWAQLPETIGPDGICLDAEGGIWCANPEGEDSVVRVLEGGRISDTIRLTTHAYAVMLGGPARKHLFICASDSHDPQEIQRNPSAKLLVADVNIPGAGTP